jgi:sec-independent protein translocase protein TatB
MFDIGFAELFLLALVGLLVLGPERLPKVAHTLGGLLRQARQSWAMMRRTIESELESAQLADPVKEVREDLESIGRDISSLPKEITAAVEQATPKAQADPESASERAATEGEEEEKEREDGGSSQ